jgi:hypothetical protein
MRYIISNPAIHYSVLQLRAQHHMSSHVCMDTHTHQTLSPRFFAASECSLISFVSRRRLEQQHGRNEKCPISNDQAEITSPRCRTYTIAGGAGASARPASCCRVMGRQMLVSESVDGGTDQAQSASSVFTVSVTLYRSHQTCPCGVGHAISLVRHPMVPPKGPSPQHASLASSNPAGSKDSHKNFILI